MYKILIIIILSIASLANYAIAKGLEDYHLANKAQLKNLKENGITADLIYLHNDWAAWNNAPLIRLKLYKDPVSVGDYKKFYDSLVGKSEIYQSLLVDAWVRRLNPDNHLNRSLEFKFFEEVTSFFVIHGYFVKETQSVWKQYQLLAWSAEINAKMKCVIASDIEERVSAFYEDSIADAMDDLLDMCNELFTRKDEPTDEISS